jgi:signal transduction histidine kinase
LAIIAFLVLVLAAWMLYFLLPRPEVAALPVAGDGYNLIGSDFANTVYSGAETWESWPERFYYPADFESGAAPDAPVALAESDYRNIQYATHRLTLTMPADRQYAVFVRSSDYAMRLYINGEEIGGVGVPGDSRESTVPRVLEKTWYFMPQSETVTLLVHAANFVHGKAGCQPPALIVGAPENIGTLTAAKTAFSFAITGCLVTAALYHLGLFLLNRKRKNALILSACCALFVIMVKIPVFAFLPEYNFFFWIRVEYLVHIFVFLTLTLFLKSLFPRLYNKWALRIFHGVIGIYALIILLTDTVFFTGLLTYFEVLAVLMILYSVIRLAASLRGGNAKNLLAFLGVLATGAAGLSDIIFYRGVEIGARFLGQYFVTPIGLVFFIFCYALVVSLEYAETERREQQLAAENASLDRMDKLKTKLMETISHEARTPLAVLASYADLVSMELKDKGTDAQIAADLDKIAEEAVRVANLIDGMRKLTFTGGETAKRVPLDIREVARQTAELYRHILTRSGVKLTLTAEESIPPVLGSPEELTQVLLNLLHNAKNHTESGSVDITVKSRGDGIAVTVADTGTGIAAELLPRVFERGVSDGSGSGIGLSLCREIIEAHGGAIETESEPGSGTSVTFTLPACKEGDRYGA